VPSVKVIGPGEGKIVWAAGDHYTFKVTGQDTGGKYSLFEGLVPPRAGPPLHFHQREFEAFYILEGDLTFHSQAGSVVAGPGTYVHIPKNLVHTFHNESNRPVRMIAIVAPAGMEHFLEEIGRQVYDRTATPAPLTQADVEKILNISAKYGIGIVLPDRTTLTSPAQTGLRVRVVKPGEGKLFWAAGDHYTFKVTGDDTGETYSLFEELVPPHAGPPPHSHQREFEAFYILEGELTFHTEEGSTVAGPGAYVHIPMNVLHTFENMSNRPVRMLAIVAPAGMEHFLEDIGRPVQDRTATPSPITQADIEQIQAIAPKYGIGINLDDPFAQAESLTTGSGQARDTEAKYSGMERSTISSPNGGPVMATNHRQVQARRRINFYKELAADYSRPEPVPRHVGDKLIAEAERFLKMKERNLPDITARYTLEQIEQENKEWWPTHCESLRRGRGDLLTAEYHENLVYFCQDGPYYGLEEQKEREQHWWALIAQPGVTMTWPIVMFHGEFVWFEWACIDDETRETIAKGSVAWVRRGHRGGCYFKGEQLTFYRDVFASSELLRLIRT
jgi:mannose-6-phosphate isomerase-like protein (cupin superfamily)